MQWSPVENTAQFHSLLLFSWCDEFHHHDISKSQIGCIFVDYCSILEEQSITDLNQVALWDAGSRLCVFGSGPCALAL